MNDPATLRLIAELAVLAVVASVVGTFVVRRALRSQAGVEEQVKRELETQRQNFQSELRATEVRAREEALAHREVLEAEIRERRAAMERDEERLRQRDAAIEERRARLESREQEIAERLAEVRAAEERVQATLEAAQAKLSEISGLDKQAARKRFFAAIEEEFREEAAQRVKAIEQNLTKDAEVRARQVLLNVMERTNSEYVTEATVAVVSLPNEEMKGRLIGREGRNIRSFEQVTGVDLIIDETPEAVVISSFDPIRRETARLALMNLMLDGRIHPGRIEELYEKAQIEVQRTIEESGERAVERAGIGGLPPKVVEAMGRLRFRTSFAQNVLDHSVEVAQICALLASELGLNVETAKWAGFLHDIGKALSPEWEGPHALAGMEFLRQFELKESILNAVGAHHREIEPACPEAQLVIIADGVSASRPGARRENLENYVKRLTALEGLANAFPGVERSFALQAGRELRVVVLPDQIDDLKAAQLARDLAKKIETEMDYPGQIRVTVIRETRVQEIAK